GKHVETIGSSRCWTFMAENRHSAHTLQARCPGSTSEEAAQKLVGTDRQFIAHCASGCGDLKLCSEPVENVAQALHPMTRLTAPRQLVVLAGEAYEPHLPPHLLQGRKELFGLFDGAAQVLLTVQDQQRRADVPYVGDRRITPVQLWILPLMHAQI